MVLSEQSVSNAVHLSFFWANFSQVLMPEMGEESMIDLKLRYHGHYYASQILKIVSKWRPSIKKSVLKRQILEDIPIIGAIHRCEDAA